MLLASHTLYMLAIRVRFSWLLSTINSRQMHSLQYGSLSVLQQQYTVPEPYGGQGRLVAGPFSQNSISTDFWALANFVPCMDILIRN